MSTALKPDFSELYRRLRSLPEWQRGEILAGELVVSPRPVLAHATAGSRMNRELGTFDRPPGGRYPGGWHILPEPELHLKTPDGQQHVLIPDIAGWRRERLPILPRKAWLDLCPDWICEVLSPSTARYDRQLKARIYHQAGVDYRWLVDPELQTVEAYQRAGDFWTLLDTWAEDPAARIPPFDAIELDMTQWWEGMEPPPPQEEPR